MEPDIFDIPESQPEPDASPRLADMTPGEMDALRTHLGLGLPLPRLMALASLYQKEKRQPADRELKLLDSLLYPLIMQPHNALLAALQTSDAPAAEALASMIEHSRAPGGITPQPTPKSALDALRHAQASADILPPPPDHASGMRLSLSHRADLPILSRHGLAPVDDLAIQGTPWHVISAAPVPSVTDKQTRTGDLYSLISPPSDEDAQSTLSRLLTAPDVAHRLCFVRYVEEGDYSDVLLSRVQGLEADLSLLIGEDYDAPLPAGYLVGADEETTGRLMPRVREAGLAFTTFARATASGRLTIAEQCTPWLSLPISPLLNLARPRTVDVRLDNPPLAKPLPSARSYTLSDHTILTRTLPLVPTLTFTDVCRALEEDITRARENAADTTTLRLAIGVTEDSTTSQCALWSSLLGLWQVLTTHNVPLLPPVFAPASGQAGAITFVCIAKASPSAQDDLPPQVEQQIRETMANRPFLARDADENM
jgi:hypothetical protein